MQPLATLMKEMQARGLDVQRLVFVSSNTEEDIRWTGLARAVIRDSPWPAVALEARYADSPLQVATMVSQELELAHHCKASLIADLTLGPKDRSAAIYVASSALRSVTILYAERHANGFQHREIPSMSDFNAWLSRHGVLIRDYKQELADLGAMAASRQYQRLNDRELAVAITDMLVDTKQFGSL